MNYWKFLPKDWQSASLIIVIVQLGMFAFLWQGQSHIKELLSNHVTGIEKNIVELKAEMKEMKAGQSELEKELKAEMKEMKAGQSELEKELKAEIKEMRKETNEKFDKIWEKLNK